MKNITRRSFGFVAWLVPSLWAAAAGASDTGNTNPAPVTEDLHLNDVLNAKPLNNPLKPPNVTGITSTKAKRRRRRRHKPGSSQSSSGGQPGSR